MALRIKWSPRAKKRYEEILDYLASYWTEKEIREFMNRTESVLKTVELHPLGFQASARGNARRAVIGKQNSMLYRVTKTHIYLITFWDNRQDPKKSKYHQ